MGQCAWVKVAEECLIKEINENFAIYLQMKIWVFPNHSRIGKYHTAVNMCLWRGRT